MSGKTYLWIEDRKGGASDTFWTTLMSHIFSDVMVESKKNNSELVKAVKSLTDKENQYLILFDNSFDNTQLYAEKKYLKNIAAAKENVYLLDFICFEYILLEFDKLIDWIYAADDEFLDKRASAIAARDRLVEMLKSGKLNYKTIREVIDYDKNIENHNIEQISARLLYDLTRNTGFEVSKGRIGECWIRSCCEWSERQSDDICGLDDQRLSLYDKMRSIYFGTSLYKEFSRIGMEAHI